MRRSLATPHLVPVLCISLAACAGAKTAATSPGPSALQEDTASDGTPAWIRRVPVADDALFAVGKKGGLRNRMLRGLAAKNKAFSEMDRRHGGCASAVVTAWFDAHPNAWDTGEELLVGMAVKGLARAFFGPTEIVAEHEDDDYSYRLARVDRATMRAGVGVAAEPLNATVEDLEAAFDVAWPVCRDPEQKLDPADGP